MLNELPIGVMHVPGAGIQDNLGERRRSSASRSENSAARERRKFLLPDLSDEIAQLSLRFLRRLLYGRKDRGPHLSQLRKLHSRLGRVSAVGKFVVPRHSFDA